MVNALRFLSSDPCACFLTLPPALVCMWLFLADLLHPTFLFELRLPAPPLGLRATWEKRGRTSAGCTLGASLCWALHVCSAGGTEK